jgi:hypothetical protein
MVKSSRGDLLAVIMSVKPPWGDDVRVKVCWGSEVQAELKRGVFVALASRVQTDKAFHKSFSYDLSVIIRQTGKIWVFRKPFAHGLSFRSKFIDRVRKKDGAMGY